MQHQAHFTRNFPSTRPVTIPGLKNPVWYIFNLVTLTVSLAERWAPDHSPNSSPEYEIKSLNYWGSSFEDLVYPTPTHDQDATPGHFYAEFLFS